MSKEVTKKENKNEVSTEVNMDEWGGSPISAKDIVLPRILLMQPMSEKVTEGEAAFGDLIESLNGEKIGDLKNPIEIIPFYMTKTFVEYNANDPKDKKYVRIVPITPENDDLPYNDDNGTDRDGKPCKIERDRCMNFYCLLPKDIENNSAIPHIVTFRRSSAKAGKKLATQMYVKNRDAGLPPPAVMVNLSVAKDSNDKGTFGVLDVNFTKKTPENHVKECLRWVKLILAGQATVHEESFEDEVETVTTKDVEGPGNF